MAIQADAEKILTEFLDATVYGKVVESEIIECKTAATSFSTDDLGIYFSALSNEANLKNKPAGWMIFGVSNDGKIHGTQYLQNPHALNSVKKELTDHTSLNYTFTTIFEFQREGKTDCYDRDSSCTSGNPNFI